MLLMMRKSTPHSTVTAMYILYFLKFFSIREAHAMTIVMLDEMRTTVFTAASGTSSSPCGHTGAPTRRRM
jgi:hypothetical protein